MKRNASGFPRLRLDRSIVGGHRATPPQGLRAAGVGAPQRRTTARHDGRYIAHRRSRTGPTAPPRNRPRASRTTQATPARTRTLCGSDRYFCMHKNPGLYLFHPIPEPYACSKRRPTTSRPRAARHSFIRPARETSTTWPAPRGSYSFSALGGWVCGDPACGVVTRRAERGSAPRVTALARHLAVAPRERVRGGEPHLSRGLW